MALLRRTRSETSSLSVVIITLSLYLLATAAPSSPQFSLDKPCEKTYQCVPSTPDHRFTLASTNCLEAIEDTVRNHLSEYSRRNHPENTWLIPPPLLSRNTDDHHSPPTCRLGLFCTNVYRATPNKINSTLLALYAALTGPAENQHHGDCTTAIAASLNIIAPPSPSSLYGWLPSPGPVLAEQNHCGVWLMTGEYFDAELGEGFEGNMVDEREKWQTADDVASVAVGRGVIYREVEGKKEEEEEG